MKDGMECLMKCTKAIDDEMRNTLKSMGVTLKHESKFSFLAVIQIQQELQMDVLRELPFVKEVRESRTGRHCSLHITQDAITDC